MKLLSIKPSTKKGKKMMATFCKCSGCTKCKPDERKVVHFGQAGSSTYLDHKDDAKKSAYLARHKVNENWNDLTSPGALSRYILWNKKTLSESIADYKSKF